MPAVGFPLAGEEVVVEGIDWFGGWFGGVVTTIYVGSSSGGQPADPNLTPVPSPIATSSPEYVDHVGEGLSRLVLQFRKPSV